MEGFSKVALEAEKVLEMNEEVETSTEEVELEPAAKGDIIANVRKTAGDCELKLGDVEDVVQKVLWQNFGCFELSLAVEAAEKE